MSEKYSDYDAFARFYNKYGGGHYHSLAIPVINGLLLNMPGGLGTGRVFFLAKKKTDFMATQST